jgi:hypothetical protein
MTPRVVLQFTAAVGDPFAKAVHWLFCRDWMAAGVQVTLMAVTGPTVRVALASFVVSCTDVAVMVTFVEAVTGCAVKTPLPLIVPALDPQETAVLKLVPVPVTVAVHWLVWPDCKEVGVQEMVTAVMEVLLPEPPPQAAIPKRANNIRIRARERKPSPKELRNEPSIL